MTYTRRQMAKLALAALPLSRLSAAKPDSRYGGVQIGIIISPYNFPEIPVAADKVLNNLVQLGISAFEMQDLRAEIYAGAPSQVRTGYSGSPSAAKITPEERRKFVDDLKQWRLSAPFDKFRALRQLYNDAGVSIYAFRLANVSKLFSDAEYDYFFKAAQALGANQITAELPESLELTKRVSEFAAQYKIRMGYHNHTQVNSHSWDATLAQSPWNGINFDVGHYAAAVSESPVPFIRAHHDRITSLHLKDRKYGTHGGENMPWGEGDTPLKEILKLVQKEHYPFPASIEFEYRIPPSSTASLEIARCLKFCREALS